MGIGKWLGKPQLWRRRRHIVMKTLRNALFPPACMGCGQDGFVFCVDCAPLVSERAVVEVESAALAVATLGVYRLSLRDAILAVKDGRRDVADALSELMAYRLGQLVADPVRVAAQAGRLCVLGVPTTFERRRQRGFDGGQFLAEALGIWWGLPVFPVLQQIAGDSQRGRGRQARLEAKGRFRLVGTTELQGYSVLLVDDVMTTGATLADVAGILHAAAVPVLGALAIARVEEGAEQLSRKASAVSLPLRLELLG